MKKVELFRWVVPQKPPKKPRLTSYHMTMEEGRARYPEGEPSISSMELREVPEPGDRPMGMVSPPMPK